MTKALAVRNPRSRAFIATSGNELAAQSAHMGLFSSRQTATEPGQGWTTAAPRSSRLLVPHPARDRIPSPSVPAGRKLQSHTGRNNHRPHVVLPGHSHILVLPACAVVIRLLPMSEGPLSERMHYSLVRNKSRKIFRNVHCPQYSEQPCPERWSHTATGMKPALRLRRIHPVGECFSLTLLLFTSPEQILGTAKDFS
jgi:hypothetical protein